ncbi:MAG TPA: polysaccharide biosynthesis tyrosine autokinase, partial [Terrimicrobiaceae bacterium]
ANLLRARAWLIATVACAVFVAALIYVLRAPRIYESQAVIQVQQEAQRVVNIAEISEERPQAGDYINTVVHALTSRKLVLRVIRSTGLDKDPSFAPPKSDGSPYTDFELAERLLPMLKVSLRRGTRLVDVKVWNQNPETAQKLAAALVREFLQESFEQRQAISRSANEFLRGEAEQLQAKLEQAERKLQAYREKTKAVSLEERQDVIVEKLREVNSAVTAAKSSRLRLEADLEQMRKIKRNDVDGLLKIGSVSKIPQVALIREQLVKAENDLAEAQERYLPMHPKYIGEKTKVANLRKSLADALSKAHDTLAREYEAAREAEHKLDQSLKDQEQRALDLNKIAIPYNVLQRDVESDRALFQSITRRLKETDITGGVDSPAFRTIDEPLVPSYPIKPRKKLILALALVVGLTLGVGTVIGMDAIDGSLRTLDEAESYLELPVLTAIPDRRKAELLNDGNRIYPLVMVDEQGSEQAEAFRTLRASVSLLAKQSEFRSFLFTSAVPSEGKTFTSINFACSLARHGRSTVLIDADLRVPRLNGHLLKDKHEELPGLTDVLCNEIALGNALKKTKQRNLILLPAGRRVSDPAELLDDQSFGLVIEQLLRDFDRVVIDSPPVNAVSDALLIAAFAQATCLVVRAGKTPKKAILRALHQLEMANANVTGLVFNRLPVGGRSADYYYYQYGSRYANHHASMDPGSIGRSTG